MLHYERFHWKSTELPTDPSEVSYLRLLLMLAKIHKRTVFMGKVNIQEAKKKKKKKEIKERHTQKINFYGILQTLHLAQSIKSKQNHHGI